MSIYEYSNIIIAGAATVTTIISLTRILGKKFEKIDARFEKIDARFEKIDNDLKEMNGQIRELKGELEVIKTVVLSDRCYGHYQGKTKEN